MPDRETTLGYTRKLGQAPVDEAIARVTEALAAEGFGVLTRIDVDETLKKKLGVSFRRYVILGACNPAIAHRALSANLEVGLLLPCNVTVFRDDDGETVLQIAKPEAMLALVGGDAPLRPLMQEADERLRRVLERMAPR